MVGAAYTSVSFLTVFKPDMGERARDLATVAFIAVSLAGKLTVSPVASTGSAIVGGGVADSVLAALTGLGWSERVATDALTETLEGASPVEASSVPTLLRLTLARLGPAQQTARAR